MIVSDSQSFKEFHKIKERMASKSSGDMLQAIASLSFAFGASTAMNDVMNIMDKSFKTESPAKHIVYSMAVIHKYFLNQIKELSKLEQTQKESNEKGFGVLPADIRTPVS